MPNYSAIYRKTHPEYYEQDRIKDNLRVKNLYHNNPEYKEKGRHQALARYYRSKEQKANANITAE